MKSWLTKYRKALGSKEANDSNQFHTGRFVAFIQLTTGIEFDRMAEGLQYELDLKKFLLKLVTKITFSNRFGPFLRFYYLLSLIDCTIYAPTELRRVIVGEFFKI